MKVLYDYQIFMQKYGGASRYFCELIEKYHVSHDVDTKIPLLLSNNYYISKANIATYYKFLPSYNFKKKDVIQRLLNKTYSSIKIRNTDFDIFHPTYYDPYFINHIGNRPFVLTVYDMIHEKFKEMFPKNDKTTEWKKYLTGKASRIIAISENTKKDLIDIFSIDDKKIDVVYLGNSLLPLNQTSVFENLPDKYILFVGSRGFYKNFTTFIKAISAILNSDKSLSVVCAGGGWFNEEEIQLFQKLNVQKQLFQFNLDDDKLSLFYKNALLFIFPSLYEGFGIPVLESFACKCPLVCSSNSSLPEIADDAAEYFNPLSENSIYVAVKRIIDDEALRFKLIKKGEERLSNFSWERTANETKQVYENCINNGH